MRFMKKTVLITGASRGIGASIARVFAENNYNVILNYSKSEKEALYLQNELSKKGYSVLAYKADITKRKEVAAMFEEGIKAFSTIDVLVNNAGFRSRSCSPITSAIHRNTAGGIPFSSSWPTRA